jgi:hypothetical protein
MILKRPKILYQYDPYKIGWLLKHHVVNTCAPQHISDGRWRCRTEHHDFYGFDMLKGAKAYERERLKSEIHEMQKWLEQNKEIQHDQQDNPQELQRS